VNKQVTHIIYAHLILASLASIFLIANKLPSTLVTDNGPHPIDPGIVEMKPALSEKAKQGKVLFLAKCASCHRIDADLTGPALKDFEQRGPWADSTQLYAWISNPSSFIKKNEYARNLQQQYKTMMTAFPNITPEEVDALREYINAY
jgi:mono/diheme cytochrome c family protein